MPRGKHNNHVSGENHPRWKGGRIIDTRGYVRVRVGASHPLGDEYGYCYEHTVVWVSAGNPEPGPDEGLHHKNEQKSDNRIENLKMVSQSRHGSHHAGIKARGANGQFQKQDFDPKDVF